MAKRCPKCQFENTSDSKFCKECGTQLPGIEEAEVTATLETPKEELTTGSTFAGRYQIIEELGRGGMGRVYKVLDKETNEKIALKLIKPEIAADKKTVERFRNELTTARKIVQKNVCRMYDLGREKGSYYITMEYISGQDLKGLIRQTGQLTVGKAVSVAKQVCDGLAEAHSLGVVHRDLKPNNIMIDQGGNAKIMDFGIARAMKGKSITGSGVMIGTPQYMSPEQVEGKDVDHRSDIYSLGIILYEMLTDRVPFDGDTPLTVGVKQKTEAPKDPREFNERIREDLSRLILKCLAKERENRFQSAGEVKSELERIEQGLPTTDRVIPKKKTLTSREITVQFSLKKFLIPVIAIGLLIAAALIIWQLLPQKKPAPSLSEKPSLAVMYFENRSGIEDLDKTLVDMLTTNMSRYERLDVVSSQRLFDILKQIGKQDAETIDRKTATEVAERAGVETMLLGSIMKIGNKVIINSHLTDVQSGNIIDSAQAEGGKIEEDIFNMVNKLTAEIGMKLNAAPKEREQELKITDVTTNSFEAYQYYQKGLHHLWRFSFGQAEENFQTAIAIDPSFSMAYFWLAMAQTTFGFDLASPFLDIESVQKTLSQAKKYSRRATEKERLLIDIGISGFDFDFKEMKASCEEIIEKYPDEKLGYLFLQVAPNFAKEIDFEDMKNAIEKTLELDPTDGFSYNSLAYNYAMQKDREGLASAIKKYKAVQPDVYNPYHTGWEAHMMLGLFDEAFGFLEELSENVPEWHAVHFWRGVHYLMEQDTDKARDEFQVWYDDNPENAASRARNLAYSYLVDGKYEKAASELHKLIEITQRENRTGNEVFGHYFLGKILAFQKKYDEAIQEYGQAERLSEKLCEQDFNPYSIYAHYLMGLASAKKGDYKAANDHADMIQSMIQEGNYSPLHSVFRYLLSAEIDVDQKNAEAARAELDKITYYWIRLSSSHFRKLQVSVMVLEGDVEGAMEYCRSSFENWITTNMGMRSLDMFDYFGERSKLDYRLAQMYEKLGDTPKAIEHYEKFLDQWKDADPGIAEVEDAKKRLAGLVM